jgi:hypothetical protein
LTFCFRGRGISSRCRTAFLPLSEKNWQKFTSQIRQYGKMQNVFHCKSWCPSKIGLRNAAALKKATFSLYVAKSRLLDVGSVSAIWSC